MSKLAKSDVRYHIAEPSQDQCQECKWFARPSGCELVKGSISPQGWCRVFHSDGKGVPRLARKENADRDYVRKMRGAA